MNDIALPASLLGGDVREKVRVKDLVRASHLSWATLAATLVPMSLIWDFSWESTVGVDRAWSPPHVATYLGTWLGALLAVTLVIGFTLARSQNAGSAPGIKVGPFCGPTGAWVLLWSAVLLQCAFLFDNWWQKTYGLSAGLWHPPQLLKTVGFFGLGIGAYLVCAVPYGKPKDTTRRKWLIAWHGGLLLTLCTLVLTMTNYPNLQHSAWFYLVSSAIYPAILLGAGCAQPGSWGATRTAFCYLVLAFAMVWLLPLFPAHPLTPPIYNPMDHLMPPPFPLLLIIPALAMEYFLHLLRPLALIRRTAAFSLPLAAGLIFFALFLPTQWYLAKFLLSPFADNWFFAGGGQHWPFFLKIDQARTMFWGVIQDPLLWHRMLVAMLLATISSWLGFRITSYLSRLRR